MGSSRATRVTLATVLTAWAVPIVAQQPTPQTPVFGSDVRVVAVPVFVTDKGGRAVPGLSAADFEIEDQGKKVPVAAFLAVDVAGEAPASESGPLLQASARRQFLLLFDLMFSTPTGIMRARDAGMAWVRDKLAPSDLVAVATYGQRGVQLLVGFTPDRLQLEQAIGTLGLVETQPRARDTLNIAYDLGVRPWGDKYGPPPADPVSGHLIEMSKLMARGEQAQYKQKVDGFLDGLDQLVQLLDSVRGRKQLVLLSAGFDSAVTGGATGQESKDASEAVVSGRIWEVQTDRYFGDSAARDSLDKVFKAVATTDTVIHTVDVSGMEAGGSAADGLLPQPTGRGRDTLAQIASNTGGRFVSNTNDLQAGLVSLQDASRHYYVLAFEPFDTKGKPDKLRKLKVRVRGEGLSVSHRRGYALANPKREATPAAAALQAADTIAKGLTGGALTLRAVAVPYRNARGRLALPVILEVDGQALSQGKAAQLGLELFGYAFDGEGRILDTMTVAPVLDVGKVRPALEAKGLQLITSFEVPEGPVDLRFFVRDPASKRTGSLRVRLEMPAFDANDVVLSPPLMMDDPRARLVVPAPSKRLPQLEIPFRLGETPFTAEPLPTLSNGATREVCLMAWGGDAGDGADDIRAELVDASGAARPIALAETPRAVADADGTVRYVMTLAPKDVPKGRYVLRVGMGEPKADGSPRSEIAVRLE
jgi:VWFA-related protein